MLEKLIKLYSAAMLFGVTSPMPHLAGPPGTGKSSVMRQLADLLGVQLHTINVSRLSPLELEGVQMPVGVPDTDSHRLHLLLSTLWRNLKEGDIVFFDEFLRGFPEVYNGLIDIMTSQEVAGYRLPKVFWVGASNSVSSYDSALEDRLLHIFVDDVRNSARAKKDVGKRLVEGTGMHPEMEKSQEVTDVVLKHIAPMFAMLDQFKHKAAIGAISIEGSSLRKILGQILFREVTDITIMDMIAYNNQLAVSRQAWQYVILLDGKRAPAGYEQNARKLVGNPRLTEIQAKNLEMNLSLIDMESAKADEEGAA